MADDVRLGPGKNVRTPEERESTSRATEDGRVVGRFFAALDILGWKHIVAEHEQQLERLVDKYRMLKDEARSNSRTPILTRQSSGRPGVVIIHARHVILSDSIWLWADDDVDSCTGLLVACSAIMCRGVELDLPIRGAISFGQVAIDWRNDIYVGPVINRAVELEHAQDWLGVGIDTACRDAPNSGHLFGPQVQDEAVTKYSVPTKVCSEKVELALLWHHYIQDPDTPLRDLRNKAPTDKRYYYDNALEFVRLKPCH